MALLASSWVFLRKTLPIKCWRLSISPLCGNADNLPHFLFQTLLLLPFTKKLCRFLPKGLPQVLEMPSTLLLMGCCVRLREHTEKCVS